MKKIDCDVRVIDCPNAGKLRLITGSYDFYYDYPLRKPVTTFHVLNQGTSLAKILDLAATDYRRIYEDDPNNVWGHAIEDLCFEGVEIDEQGKKITFIMGS